MMSGEKFCLWIYIPLPEKPQRKDHSPENTINLMNWENITVRCAETIYSDPLQNFPAVVAGRVFLKQIKKECITKEILPMEWKG